jgi:heavy metal translocating P-type ATPase
MGCRNVHAILVESGIAKPGVDLRETDLYKRSLELGLVANVRRDVGRSTIPEGAPSQDRLYHVSGMWCGSCAWLIEHTLTRDPGIASAEVLFTSDLLKVRYYPQYVPPGRIEQRVASLGYDLAEYDAENSAADGERRSLLLRLGVAAFLWINVMMLNLAVYLGYFEQLQGSMRRLLPFVVMTLAAPVIFYSAMPILRLAWGGLREGIVRMEGLLALGIVSAYGYSAVQAFRGGTHIYFDIACAIVTLVLLGKWIERSAKEGAARSINMLYRSLPKKARLIQDAHERFVAVDALKPGDLFVVKAGERIPADGVVMEGESQADESIVTGESKPAAKRSGSMVLGGSLNIADVLRIQATTLGEDSTLARIVRSVEHALGARAGIERTVDRVSRIFGPAVIAIAALVALASLAGGQHAGDAIMRAVTVLVIACPCALGIATPLALTAAVGAASRSGILIRDMRVLELAGRIDTLVLDKTGTVTTGEFAVLDADARHLPVVAAIEVYSEHAIGRAIVRAAQNAGASIPAAEDVRVLKGRGITGRVEGREVFAGSRGFASERAAAPVGSSHEAATCVHYGWDGEVRGIIRVGDRIRAEAAEVIAAMRQRGIRVLIASGDSQETTAAVARLAGATDFAAELLPEAKLKLIEDLRAQGRSVAMVGDGVNDAPALAAAHLGIAMGSGADIAMNAAAVVLMTSDLRRVSQTFDLAARTLRIVYQNLFWAFFYNVAGISLAAFGLLNPIVAAAAMACSSIFVVGNSRRLGRSVLPGSDSP